MDRRNEITRLPDRPLASPRSNPSAVNRVIWVSSVIAPHRPYAGAYWEMPLGPNWLRICSRERNSTGAPRASSTAPPSMQPLMRDSIFMAYQSLWDNQQNSPHPCKHGIGELKPARANQKRIGTKRERRAPNPNFQGSSKLQVPKYWILELTCKLASGNAAQFDLATYGSRTTSTASPGRSLPVSNYWPSLLECRTSLEYHTSTVS